MSNLFNRISQQVIGYLFMLVSFAALGVMIAALAMKSDLAAVAGIAFVISAIASVEGFRSGAARLAESRRSGEHMSIWSTPIAPEQIDRYRATYRSAPGPTDGDAVTDRAALEDAEQPVAA
ncbi:hypothetical protein BHQ17_12450 [Mycolicibacterium holsaticum]|jgi:hypothetical protein|uniref:Uncharacterized protein n=3 Tax=Mycolicibacterium holsaticum TaxID=152142 RepID=A0A1E3RUY1_9MYCO|nr:hypothetical protein [Mycolicibacterium holsaticum DSM 44478 = JCM 12374]ODQ93648.1 hypothetical protein BHQ17_12450 [Mycolicibacterium holsaticum]